MHCTSTVGSNMVLEYVPEGHLNPLWPMQEIACLPVCVRAFLLSTGPACFQDTCLPACLLGHLPVVMTRNAASDTNVSLMTEKPVKTVMPVVINFSAQTSSAATQVRSLAATQAVAQAASCVGAASLIGRSKTRSCFACGQQCLPLHCRRRSSRASWSVSASSVTAPLRVGTWYCSWMT